jgi:ABC-2 type transport system permease protein
MAFLSGVFFPLDSAPGWLQTIGSLMPMHWVVEALRDVAVRDGGLGAALPDLGLIGVFTALTGAICLRFFRWSRE